MGQRPTLLSETGAASNPLEQKWGGVRPYVAKVGRHPTLWSESGVASDPLERKWGVQPLEAKVGRPTLGSEIGAFGAKVRLLNL